MKAVVVFLFGITTALAGAFIRSCQSIPPEFLQAWCGAPPQQLAFAMHQHCTGCALIATGIGLVALAPLPGGWKSGPAARLISG